MITHKRNIQHKQNRYGISSFFREGMPLLQLHLSLHRELLKENLSKLDEHLEKYEVFPEMYAVKWTLTLFTYVLPFATVARVWDRLLVLGPSIGILLFSLGIMRDASKKILEQKSTEGILKILTTHDIPPDNMIKAALSFKSGKFVKSVEMYSEKWEKENPGQAQAIKDGSAKRLHWHKAASTILEEVCGGEAGDENGTAVNGGRDDDQVKTLDYDSVTGSLVKNSQNFRGGEDEESSSSESLHPDSEEMDEDGNVKRKHFDAEGRKLKKRKRNKTTSKKSGNSNQNITHQNKLLQNTDRLCDQTTTYSTNHGGQLSEGRHEHAKPNSSNASANNIASYGGGSASGTSCAASAASSCGMKNNGFGLSINNSKLFVEMELPDWEQTAGSQTGGLTVQSAGESDFEGSLTMRGGAHGENGRGGLGHTDATSGIGPRSHSMSIGSNTMGTTGKSSMRSGPSMSGNSGIANGDGFGFDSDREEQQYFDRRLSMSLSPCNHGTSGGVPKIGDGRSLNAADYSDRVLRKRANKQNHDRSKSREVFRDPAFVSHSSESRSKSRELMRQHSG